MIMLMLIHFDAYGYELAAVFQEVNAEHVLPVSEAETQIVQGNDVEIEWLIPSIVILLSSNEVSLKCSLPYVASGDFW